jgi:hypothetical protein
MDSLRADLPFFAYGTFKPGQLGFLRLRKLVERIEPDCVLSGTLRERDGLPIVDEEGSGWIQGSLLFFKREKVVQAYMRIIEIEPDKHYRWDTGSVRARGGTQVANVLFGRSPKKGSVSTGASDWDGKEDPLFTSALAVVQETLDHNQGFEPDLKPLFRLQMAYLLLWSAIERYVSLRYHLGDKVVEKVNQMAGEDAFVEGLQRLVSDKRSVYRADRPSDRVRLDPSKPKESIGYYYQVRSNITHRGKAAVNDFLTLKSSLEELHKIFRNVLDAAFKEAEDRDQQSEEHRVGI